MPKYVQCPRGSSHKEHGRGAYNERDYRISNGILDKKAPQGPVQPGRAYPPNYASLMGHLGEGDKHEKCRCNQPPHTTPPHPPHTCHSFRLRFQSSAIVAAGGGVLGKRIPGFRVFDWLIVIINVISTHNQPRILLHRYHNTHSTLTDTLGRVFGFCGGGRKCDKTALNIHQKKKQINRISKRKNEKIGKQKIKSKNKQIRKAIWKTRRAWWQVEHATCANGNRMPSTGNKFPGPLPQSTSAEAATEAAAEAAAEAATIEKLKNLLCISCRCRLSRLGGD